MIHRTGKRKTHKSKEYSVSIQAQDKMDRQIDDEETLVDNNHVSLLFSMFIIQVYLHILNR